MIALSEKTDAGCPNWVDTVEKVFFGRSSKNLRAVQAWQQFSADRVAGFSLSRCKSSADFRIVVPWAEKTGTPRFRLFRQHRSEIRVQRAVYE
jgi:hypothetical protein